MCVCVYYKLCCWGCAYVGECPEDVLVNSLRVLLGQCYGMGRQYLFRGPNTDCMAYVGDHVTVVLTRSRLVRVAETSAGRRNEYSTRSTKAWTLVQLVIFCETDKYRYWPF